MSVKDIKKILVPVDMTGLANDILVYAKGWQDALDAELKVINVVPELGDYSMLSFPLDAIAELETSFAKEAHEKLDKLVDDVLGQGVATEVLLGDIVSEILRHSREWNADMIIMGSREHKGWDRLIFGSVAQGVFSRAEIPVLILNPNR